MKTLLKSILPERTHGPLKEVAYRAISLAYSGDRLACPFCHRQFRRMIPRGLKHAVLAEKQVIGSGYRPDAFCPGCLSYDRERLVYLYLKNKTDVLSRPVKLLHVAPERQLEKVFRHTPTIDYLTGDLFAEVVDVKLDVTAMQFPDDTFDVTLCNHVMEHVPEDRKAMSEILRTLKPGGFALIQTPISKVLEATFEDFSVTSEAEKEVAFGQKDHCRIYAHDYRARLASAGFQVEVFDWMKEPEGFGNPENRFALNPEEMVFICRKPQTS